MRGFHLPTVVVAILALGPGVSRADIGPISVADFDVFPGMIHSHTEPGVPGGQVIHGMRVVGDWVASIGSPLSDEFRMYAVSPGGGASSALSYGGTADSDPYSFAESRFLAFVDGASSAGDWKLGFTTSSVLPGNTARMSNVEVTLLDNSVVSYGGDTSGAAEWDRPRNGFSALSPLGPVRYHVQPFVVDATGRYDIFSSQTYDGYLLLYEGGFDPLDPLANGLTENDDGRIGPGSSDIWQDLSGGGLHLTVGTTYYLVTTGFAIGDEGTFDNYIGGVGEVALVPEPSALSLLALGALALRRGRRRRWGSA